MSYKRHTRCSRYTLNKSLNLNKNIKKDFGLDVIAIYKRSANILNSESKLKLEIVGSVDPGLFKNDYEKKS